MTLKKTGIPERLELSETLLDRGHNNLDMARYGPLLVSPKNLPPGHLSHLVIFSQIFLKKKAKYFEI